MEPAEKELSSWDKIHSYGKRGWIFRGQRDATWKLETSLERCCKREGIGGRARQRLEKDLFRDFRRFYHQYAEHVPAKKNVVEWQSLMQHHGAPTRLLDFTYSIYVAAYFALENAGGNCAVWAVNGPWLLRESLAIFAAAGKDRTEDLKLPTQEGHEAAGRSTLFEPPFVRGVLPLTPFRQNERLRIQRGTFLIPGDVSTSLMKNLSVLPGSEDSANVLKVILPKKVRAVGLEQLYAMNISRMSLFPGLDGYAQSLGVFHPGFRPVSWVTTPQRFPNNLS